MKKRKFLYLFHISFVNFLTMNNEFLQCIKKNLNDTGKIKFNFFLLSGEPRLFEGGLFQSELWPADILQHHQLTDRGVPLWRQHHQTGSDSGRPHTGEPVFDAYTGSVALSWLYRTFQQSAERAGVGGICEKRHRRKFTDCPVCQSYLATS